MIFIVSLGPLRAASSLSTPPRGWLFRRDELVARVADQALARLADVVALGVPAAEPLAGARQPVAVVAHRHVAVPERGRNAGRCPAGHLVQVEQHPRLAGLGMIVDLDRAGEHLAVSVAGAAAVPDLDPAPVQPALQLVDTGQLGGHVAVAPGADGHDFRLPGASTAVMNSAPASADTAADVIEAGSIHG